MRVRVWLLVCLGLWGVLLVPRPGWAADPAPVRPQVLPDPAACSPEQIASIERTLESTIGALQADTRPPGITPEQVRDRVIVLTLRVLTLVRQVGRCVWVLNQRTEE